MLPEVLSNGVCSLQEGQVRWVKSVFIDYDTHGVVMGARFANGAIRSAKRLTYRHAQAILDGGADGEPVEVVQALREMERLARAIEARRREDGMLHLDLPEVELVLSPEGRVIDAKPPDTSYTHTLIEMFMVEANEAVATLLHRMKVPCLRRVHPEGAADAARRLGGFLAAVGVRLGRAGNRHSLQDVLAAVAGRPQSYAVNLAVLKTLRRAEYSLAPIGHFALASRHYCHFTSPIRRYPDLTVHRLLDAHLRGALDPSGVDPVALARQAEHSTATERKAEAAEKDLRTLLVLQLFAGRLGEKLDGVVTGVTAAGLFVQSTRYLVEGFLRLDELGPDWTSDPERGMAFSYRSGDRLRLGDPVAVRVLRVDLDRRRLDLALERLPKTHGTRHQKQAHVRTQGRRRGGRRGW
jgi:ribonuclease R